MIGASISHIYFIMMGMLCVQNAIHELDTRCCHGTVTETRPANCAPVMVHNHVTLIPSSKQVVMFSNSKTDAVWVHMFVSVPFLLQ